MDCRLKGRDGVVPRPLCVETLAEIVLGQRVVGTQFGCALEKGSGVTNPALLRKGHAEVELNLRPRRVKPRRPAQGLLRCGITLLLDQTPPKSQPGGGEIGILADELLQDRHSFRHAVLLEQAAGAR